MRLIDRQQRDVLPRLRRSSVSDFTKPFGRDVDEPQIAARDALDTERFSEKSFAELSAAAATP